MFPTLRAGEPAHVVPALHKQPVVTKTLGNVGNRQYCEVVVGGVQPYPVNVTRKASQMVPGDIRQCSGDFEGIPSAVPKFAWLRE